MTIISLTNPSIHPYLHHMPFPPSRVLYPTLHSRNRPERRISGQDYPFIDISFLVTVLSVNPVNKPVNANEDTKIEWRDKESRERYGIFSDLTPRSFSGCFLSFLLPFTLSARRGAFVAPMATGGLGVLVLYLNAWASIECSRWRMFENWSRKEPCLPRVRTHTHIRQEVKQTV